MYYEPRTKGRDLKVKTQSKKVNKAWLNDHVNDPYVKKAQKEGYRARAAYKLKEIDETFGLFKPGMVVVDLGSTPGAWSQYLRRCMAPDGSASGDLNGSLFAVDLLPMDPIEGVSFLQGDFRDQVIFDKLVEQIGNRSVDAVVSDMAPNLSGISEADAARMVHLIELAIEFCQLHLKKDGSLVVKVFHGNGYDQVVQLFKSSFKMVKPFKPKASRAKSSENFLIGIGLK